MKRAAWRQKEEAAKVSRKGLNDDLVHLMLLWYLEPQLITPRDHLVAQGTYYGQPSFHCWKGFKSISPSQSVERQCMKIAAQRQRQEAIRVTDKGLDCSLLVHLSVHLIILWYVKSQLTALKDEQFAAVQSRCLEAPDITSAEDSLKATPVVQQSICCQDGCYIRINVTSRKRKGSCAEHENRPTGNPSKKVKTLIANRTEQRVSVVRPIPSNRPHGLEKLGGSTTSDNSTRGKGSPNRKPFLYHYQGERRTRRHSIRPYKQQLSRKAELTSSDLTQARNWSVVKKPSCSSMVSSLNRGLKTLSAHGPGNPNVSLNGNPKSRYAIRKGPCEMPIAPKSQPALCRQTRSLHLREV